MFGGLEDDEFGEARRLSTRRGSSTPLPLANIVSSLVGDTVEGKTPKRRRVHSKNYRVFSEFLRMGGPFCVHAEPVFFRAGILTLAVDDPTWLTEFTFLRERMCAALNERLGENLVVEIRLRLGGSTRRRSAFASTLPLFPPPKLDPSEVARVETWAGELRDADVRAAFMRAARWSFSRNHLARANP